MNTKLVIGTANFFNNYGILRNKIGAKEAISIGRYLKKKNILFDTSLGYKNLDKILSLYNKYNFNFIIKIVLNSKNQNNLEEIFKKIQKKYKINKKFYAILLHNSNILKTKKGILAYNKLYNLKKKKISKKIGISTYGIENIMLMENKKINYDIIQTSGNILDNRIFKFLKLSKKLKKKEIHIRSIFLQGLLLKKTIPSKFKKFSKVFNKIKTLSKKHNINILKLLIHHVYKQKVNGIVIGIKCKSELKEIIHNFNNIKKIKNFNYKLNVANSLIIDPRKW